MKTIFLIFIFVLFTAVGEAAGTRGMSSGVAAIWEGGGAPAAISLVDSGWWMVDSGTAMLGAAIPEPSGKEILTFLGCVLAIVGIYVGVLKALDTHRKFFGRTPSMDEEIAALRKSLSGLAPSEKVDKLVEKLAGAATKQEVADVLALVTAMVDKEVGQHRTDVHNQLTEMRAYLHKGVHDIGQGLQSLTSAGEERDQRLNDKLDKHWHDLSRERSTSTARLHERIEAITEKQRTELDAKVKDLREEISEMPMKLIGILKDTGAIKGGNR